MPSQPGQNNPLVAAFSSRCRDVLGNELVRILWFGSRARGDAKPDSDYDFLVETRQPIRDCQREQMADVSIDLCADYGAVLDVHYYSSERMRRAPERFTPFVQQVLAEGVAV